MDKALWWFFLIVILGTIALAMWLLTLPSNAEDYYGGLDWRWDAPHTGGGVRHHHRPHVRYYRTPDRDEGRRYELEARHEEREGWQCLDHPMFVLSTEHTEAALAMESAKKLWSSTVQWNFGSRFMNLENAADEKVKCDQSNAMDTISGRLVEGAQKLVGNDGFNVRCVISARPCSAPLENAEEKR